MSDGMFLDDDEIAQLTRRQRKPAQSKVLSYMGIEHKRRPDGSLVVLRAHVERLLGGATTTRIKPKNLPDFSMVE